MTNGDIALWFEAISMVILLLVIMGFYRGAK